MSYVLIDENGDAAEFASNAGVAEIEDHGPEALKRFVESGEASAGEAFDLTVALANTEYDYIASALLTLSGDVFLSNGIVDADENDWEDYAYEEDFSQWEESEHPRHPEGTSVGGEFAPKGEEGAKPEPHDHERLASLARGFKGLIGPDNPEMVERHLVGRLANNDSLNEEVAKTLMDTSKKWATKLTSLQSGIIHDYTASDYGKINDCLRKSKDCDVSVGVGSTVSEAAKLMMTALDASMPKPVTVYRKVAFDNETVKKLFQPGQIFKDNGFSSTTLMPEAHLGMGYNVNVEMVISVPKGAKAMFLDGLSEHADEAEVLLNAGSRFKVNRIEQAQEIVGPRRDVRPITRVHVDLL